MTETKKNSHLKNKNRKLVKKSVSDKIEKTENKAEVKVDDIIKLEDGNGSPVGVGSVGLPAEVKPEEKEEVADLRCKPPQELFNANISSISQLNIDISQNKAFLENLLTNQIEINRVDKKTTDVKNSLTQFNKLKNVRNEEKHKSYSIPSSGKIMNYSDLPYMGEITLDGIKPRRGRKPKKADICHLIYKNYGQVFPGAPGKDAEEPNKKRWRPDPKSSQITKAAAAAAAAAVAAAAAASSERNAESPLPTVSGLISHSEVQNRIINSLLEKRLTQEMKSKADSSPKEGLENGEEPLNLCIRDLQSLKIKLSRKHGNIYETKNKEPEEIKIKAEEEIKKESKTDSEIESTDEEEEEEEDDLAPFNLVTTELRESSDDDSFLNFNDQITLTKIKSPDKIPKENPSPPVPDPNVVYWPGSNVFLRPVPAPLLCYQRLPEDARSEEKKPAKSKNPTKPPMKRIAPKTSPNAAAHVITKRKRSAIFIPPVPAENTANPTTEVSICKFKFTGGAKPSLQEKKMLSVDSGGNFRYYSGTGDKSMRGYEYFPRESLQQCQENTGCSPSGVFLTASALGSGEKIPEEIGHSGFFDTDFPIQLPANPKPEEKKPKMKNKPKKNYQSLREHLTSPKSDSSDVVILPSDSSDNSNDNFDVRNLMQQKYFADNFKIQEESMSGRSDESSSRNKKSRKTRKSLAREKLEQTFKEKGFLIQTQQLESAEGATYCKFRQLRKFTRYLFRSWKDYLPGNVRDLSVDAGVENNEMPNLLEGALKIEELESQEKSS